MDRLKLAEWKLDALIELAVRRQLIDRAVREGGHYRLEIGAARFTLDEEETGELLRRLIRSRSTDVE